MMVHEFVLAALGPGRFSIITRITKDQPRFDMPASSTAPTQNASRPKGHPSGRLVEEVGASRRLEQAAMG